MADSFTLVFDRKGIENMDFSIIKEFIMERDFNEASQGTRLLALCFCSVADRGMDGNYFLQPDTSKLREFALVNFGMLNEFMEEHKLTDGINNEIFQNIPVYLHKWLDRSE
jgi:hypothetical protein